MVPVGTGGVSGMSPAAETSGPGHSARLCYTEPMLRRAVRIFVIRRAMASRLSILTVGMVIAGLVLGLEGSTDLQLGFALAGLLFVAAFVAAVWRAHVANTIGRFRAMDPPEADMVATDRDITFISTLGSATLPWTRFTEVWELEDCWMLFTAPSQFSTLPLATLDREARDFLRARLSEAQWVFAPLQRVTSRLSREQACAIAGEVVDAGVRHWIAHAEAERRGEGLVWVVSSLTKGSGVRVIVDDATGRVIDVGRWGNR